MDENVQSQNEVFNNFQKMTVNEEDVNILLLGETGVGKSTFINSFANYLEYDKFDIAEKNKVRCLIPAKFTVTDENFDEKIVQIGSDDNENDKISESATFQTRSYVFPYNQVSTQAIKRIRLIDTPGIGDTRGIDQDNENMENILSYISHLENLHAICFLLKPNNARLTVMFHYCIKQLLSRLEKSASKNIIFLFTNTRSSFYKPGDTTTALKKILEDIKNRPPYVELKFMKDNVFCLDNESFRYMVAVKSGINLGNRESFIQSWAHSVEECWRMIRFITGQGNSEIKITPHKVKDTISVNEARRVILQLSQPLADIAELINDNINILDRHNKSLQTDNTCIEELKHNLYVPVINLRCKELSQPTTICTAEKCCEIYMVGTSKKYHYKQRCHDPCYLTNVPRELIGSPLLIHCYAMTNRKCRECSCDFSTHMHVYYLSETFEDKIDNAGVKAQIKDREMALKETRKLIAQIEARKLTYEKEKSTIIKTMAKFAHFLQRNAIAPYNDTYKAYIEYLIDREKSSGQSYDMQMVKYYNELLNRYDEEKKVLDDALSNSSGSHSAVTAASVFDSIKTLYQLPNTGKQIQKLYSISSKNQNIEHSNTELVLNEANKQAYQKKQDDKKNFKQKPKKPNNKNVNEKNRAGMHSNNSSHMKAKNKRAENYQQQNKTQQGYHGYQGYSQNPHRNMQNPHNFPIAPLMQHQVPPPGNFSSYPGQHGNFYNFPPPPPPHYGNYFPQQPGGFPNFPSNPGVYPDYPRQQQNFGNRFGQGQNIPNYQGQQKYDQPRSQFHPNEFSNNQHTSTDSRNHVNDPKFDEWYRQITGVGDNTDVPLRHYNNLAKQQTSSEDESDSDKPKPRHNDSDDDHEFKEFMKQNKLSYLVKGSGETKAVNDNTNKDKKRNKQNFESSNNRLDDDSDSDESKNNSTKTKKKGLFANLLPF